MNHPAIRFDDGARYEAAMGVWSRLAGEVFLNWLRPPLGLRWVDIGCGNGAFTQLLFERCAPVEVHGIDPSEAQLAYARARTATRRASFLVGDAMALPYADDGFDAAVMALVIVFVPDPLKSVEEMVRVVRPGGSVATYVWDMQRGGFPLDPIVSELRAMGHEAPRPPQLAASRVEALRALWARAGLQALSTREITVQRTFASFEEFWHINLMGSTVRAAVSALSAADADVLKRRVHARVSVPAGGPVVCIARANAIRGCSPA